MPSSILSILRTAAPLRGAALACAVSLAACAAGDDDNSTDGIGGGGLPTTPTPAQDSGTAPVPTDAGTSPTPTPDPGVDPGTNPGDESCAAETAEAEVAIQGADIIFAIDNSCSMGEEAQGVQDNMNRFAQTLFDSGIDARVVIVSSANVNDAASCAPLDFVCQLNNIGGDYGVCIDAPFGSGSCPNDSRPPEYLHIDRSVGSSNALDRLVEEYPNYMNVLRPETTKHFVVVTDDNSDMAAADFSTRVAGLDAALFSDWYFNGIYSFTDCPDAAEIGSVYQELVTQTGGDAGDLCLQDFQAVFDRLAQAVTSRAEIACDWPIPAPPNGLSLDPDKVNVRFTTPDGTVVDIGRVADAASCGDAEGWHYDDEANPTRVLSCDAACDRFQLSGGKVDVLFGCASVPIL